MYFSEFWKLRELRARCQQGKLQPKASPTSVVQVTTISLCAPGISSLGRCKEKGTETEREGGKEGGRERERESERECHLCSLLPMTLILILQDQGPTLMTSCNLNYFLRCPSAKRVTGRRGGVRVLTYKWQGDRNMKSLAGRIRKQWPECMRFGSPSYFPQEV